MTYPRPSNGDVSLGAGAVAIGCSRRHGGCSRPRFSALHPRRRVFRSSPNRVIELSLSFDFDVADSRVFTRGSVSSEKLLSDFGSNRAVIRSYWRL